MKETSANALRKHGHARTPEYRIWKGIKNRCYNRNDPGWPRYGGNNIVMCDEWRNSFPAFLRDVGPRPTAKHSIDRIDSTGNYEPRNVRWATAYTQSNNRPSYNRFIEHDGRRQTVAQWARELGVNASALGIRLRNGWSVERALTEPYYFGPHI